MRQFINLIERANVLDNSEFKAWFAGSKVIDNDNKPLVCYHGTFRDFAKFENHDNGWAGNGFNRIGFWFDVAPETPNWLAGYEEGYGVSTGANVKPCYLSIKNPIIFTGEMIWEEDISNIQTLRKNMSDAFNYWNAVKNGASWLSSEAELKYRNAGRAYDTAMSRFMKDDPWTRLRRLLPNGENATTSQVAEFQQECIVQGYDGIHLVQTMADAASRNYRPTDWWIAFKPNQIKSIFNQNYNTDDKF